MTLNNSHGVNGNEKKQLNINPSMQSINAPNVKKGISSAGLLATLFSPLYPRSSSKGSNDGSGSAVFPIFANISPENSMDNGSDDNNNQGHLSNGDANIGRQVSTTSSSSLGVDHDLDSALPPRLRTAQSLDNIQGMLHLPVDSKLNEETHNVINNSSNERWQKVVGNNAQNKLQSQMSSALHNLHPLISEHNGSNVNEMIGNSNIPNNNNLFTPHLQKATSIGSPGHNAHPASPCLSHVSSYHQCLELNPDMKGNCNWAFDNIIKCQENMHSGIGRL